MSEDGNVGETGGSPRLKSPEGVKFNRPGAYATTGAENEPLLNEDRARASHRSIGQDAAHSSLPNEVEAVQGRLYKTRESYHIFVQDSRIVLNVLISINLIWLVITFLVDFFFNIGLPFSNRLVSFDDLCLIFVSIVANSLNLWSNRVGLYSKLDQGLNIVLFSMTLFNLFLTFIISYTRRRIGFIGTFTYVWAALTFFAGAVLDWYLYYYYREFHAFSGDYDERPSPEGTSRHTIKEWMSIGARNAAKCLIFVFYVFFTLNTLLYAIDVGRLTHGVKDVTADASASYDAFHWVDKEHTYQLHITCYGDLSSQDKDQQPIVLFDHGSLDTGFLSAVWIQELYHLNRVNRYCTYERPGYGLSDSAPAPVSIAMVADALSYALTKDAKIVGPFSLVGYDIGGLYAQVFAAKNLDKVDSMLLVESWHEDILLKNYLQRLLPPDNDSKDPDDISKLPVEIKRHNGFKLWWQGLWSTLGLKLQTSWLLAHHGSKERIYGRDLQYQGKFIRSKFLESITSSLLSYKDVLNAKEKLRDVKLSVASSDQLIKKSPQWGNWQRDITKLSKKTQEWKILNGGHEVYKYGTARKEVQDVLLRLLGDKDRY
ncbi:LAME_0H06744g1_1 [Lachancea meyersii CBS 8951]|uniref:LAME_0H06744g1_1 n=1 Tax=Lachancea meyersii CBS 8951 TaxID=1266667 RepID=A0A1G4KEL1_9SACH|nr:LAME_0H06744g1_1 [Lachancea meyersii CBS 8951]